MGRKKKEPLVVTNSKDGHTITINRKDMEKFYDIYAPAESIDATSLTDTYARRVASPYTITTTTSDGSSPYIVYPPDISTSGYAKSWTTTLSGTAFGPMTDKSEEEIDDFLSKTEKVKKENMPKTKTYKRKEPEFMGERYRIVCDNTCDLLPDRILKNLSIIKSKMFIEAAPKRLYKIECKMTPAVKKNIILAYKRLDMYGKKTPFVARFDEYGRRLEDEVKLDTLEGMTISIVDPSEYGELYLEFTGLEESSYVDIYSEDLPF